MSLQGGMEPSLGCCIVYILLSIIETCTGDTKKVLRAETVFIGLFSTGIGSVEAVVDFYIILTLCHSLEVKLANKVPQKGSLNCKGETGESELLQI